MRNYKNEGLPVFGTYSPDGFFGAGSYRHFDAVLAMYHDQGLAPFKALSMDDGVNFTAGLNVVRTSPDHGTAYDIAGQGKPQNSPFCRLFMLPLTFIVIVSPLMKSTQIHFLSLLDIIAKSVVKDKTRLLALSTHSFDYCSTILPI